jgi:alkanesulfonate monooxygenase SsuD/methylene tetrahydromethanopterin reductase-like flavin-dependent oxidoreductase (luciferase family)
MSVGAVLVFAIVGSFVWLVWPIRGVPSEEMKGDAYRALCLYAERNGYTVHLETVTDGSRHSVLSRLGVWRDGEEVEAVAIVGDPDHAAESLLRWLARGATL